jgi:Endonuclease I
MSISKSLPRVDIYTGFHVPDHKFSREHIIPKSVLLKAGLNGSVWDLDNLYCSDASINSMRSNYKYVDCGDTDTCGSILYNAEKTLEIQDNPVMVINKVSKTVAPPTIARGAIARSVYKMYCKYNALYDYRHLVLEEDLLNSWIDLPKYRSEIMHDTFRKTVANTKAR